MKKKIILLLTVATMAMATFVGCGGSNSTSSNVTNPPGEGSDVADAKAEEVAESTEEVTEPTEEVAESTEEVTESTEEAKSSPSSFKSPSEITDADIATIQQNVNSTYSNLILDDNGDASYGCYMGLNVDWTTQEISYAAIIYYNFETGNNYLIYGDVELDSNQMKILDQYTPNSDGMTLSIYDMTGLLAYCQISSLNYNNQLIDVVACNTEEFQNALNGLRSTEMPTFSDTNERLSMLDSGEAFEQIDWMKEYLK